MARTILVPLDGSSFGERALPLAARLACNTDAVLHLVRVHVPHVQPPISLEGPVSDPQQDALRWDAERTYLTRIRRGLAVVSVASARIAVLDGPVAEGLADYAAVNQVDLIVMSTHGRSGLGRAWMGSVGDALLRRSPAPVLLVRPADDRETAAAEGPPRILVPLDGSPLADEILEHALVLGRSLGARYSLLLVVNPLALMGDLPTVLPPGMFLGAAASHVAEARAYLAERARPLKDLGLEVETKVVESEAIADAILTESARQGCAFVAMATHGRSGLSRFVLGSVAAQVVHGAATPVLLYRPTARRRHRTEQARSAAVTCA